MIKKVFKVFYWGMWRWNACSLFHYSSPVNYLFSLFFFFQFILSFTGLPFLTTQHRHTDIKKEKEEGGGVPPTNRGIFFPLVLASPARPSCHPVRHKALDKKKK